jgi:hypothetical protein
MHAARPADLRPDAFVVLPDFGMFTPGSLGTSLFPQAE